MCSLQGSKLYRFSGGRNWLRYQGLWSLLQQSEGLFLDLQQIRFDNFNVFPVLLTATTHYILNVPISDDLCDCGQFEVADFLM